MKIHLLALLLPGLVLASCASDSASEKPVATEAPARKGLKQRMNESNGYKKDADGNWVPQNDRRSEFESKGESYFAKKNYKKQEYKTGDYTKKSWWGNKEYDRQAYAGNTDGSRFQKASAQQGKSAREASTNADVPDNYDTGTYATSAANEADTAAIKKTSNDAIENRRKLYKQPGIIDWREERSLSLDQSKGILGR